MLWPYFGMAIIDIQNHTEKWIELQDATRIDHLLKLYRCFCWAYTSWNRIDSPLKLLLARYKSDRCFKRFCCFASQLPRDTTRPKPIAMHGRALDIRHIRYQFWGVRVVQWNKYINYEQEFADQTMKLVFEEECSLSTVANSCELMMWQDLGTLHSMFVILAKLETSTRWFWLSYQKSSVSTGGTACSNHWEL